MPELRRLRRESPSGLLLTRSGRGNSNGNRLLSKGISVHGRGARGGNAGEMVLREAEGRNTYLTQRFYRAGGTAENSTFLQQADPTSRLRKTFAAGRLSAFTGGEVVVSK
jgi:hypothetical protein